MTTTGMTTTMTMTIGVPGPHPIEHPPRRPHGKKQEITQETVSGHARSL